VVLIVSPILLVWAVIPFLGALITAKEFKPSIDSKFFAHLMIWYLLWLPGSLLLAYWFGAV